MNNNLVTKLICYGNINYNLILIQNLKFYNYNKLNKILWKEFYRRNFSSTIFNKNNNINNNDKKKNDINLNYDSKVPTLFYFHSPFKYLRTKYQLIRLKLLWDRSFRERDFLYGSKQAVAVLTDAIRDQLIDELPIYTTPLGFHQISRDMLVSRMDPRLKLIRFRLTDLRRSIPVRCAMIDVNGQRHCLVDVFYVGLRNANDFKSNKEYKKMRQLFREYEEFIAQISNSDELPKIIFDMANKVIFAEIFVRFYRDYTPDLDNLEDWSISFYKIINFSVLTIKK